MGGIQNIIKFSDCRDFYVFLLLDLLSVLSKLLNGLWFLCGGGCSWGVFSFV
jgi:hypothetical protein